MATAAITKPKDKTQDAFVISHKKPNQWEVEWTHSRFVKLKANLPKSGNNPQNSVKCEHFIFGLGHVGPLPKILLNCKIWETVEEWLALSELNELF